MKRFLFFVVLLWPVLGRLPAAAADGAGGPPGKQEAAPDLPPGLAPCLWRECILPWARAAELAHLADP